MERNSVVTIFSIFSFCLVLSCQSIPVQHTPGKSALVVSFEITPPIDILGLGKVTPDEAYLVQLGSNGDLMAAKAVAVSNWSKGTRLYFFGLDPGQYAIVGVRWKPNTQGATGLLVHRTLFNEELVKATTVKVEADTFGAIGQIALKAEISGGSPVQNYYRPILSQVPAGPLQVPYYDYGKSLTVSTDDGARNSLLSNARLDVADSNWKETIKP